jgi:hypothetical protein
MNDKLNYQQAKRLREQSLTSVLADQLIMGEGYGSAIGKAISLKTRAKITGIKQKFDPLNIAKFLTGGSRLGPAIVGKMLGRSRKDIEFFAGRARPVTSRNKKIGALPGGEDTTGMTSVLENILTFLYRSHEDDMILREKENNLREGEKHEDDRRHKDLLKALGVKVQGPTATPVVQKSEGGGIGGLFDSIIQAVKDMIDKAMLAFDWLKELKWLQNIGNWAKALLGAVDMVAFLNMLPLAAFLAPFVLAAMEKEKIRQNPEAPEYKDNAYAMSLRGEAATEGQAAEINTRKSQGRKVLRNEIAQAVAGDYSDKELKELYGADKKELTEWTKTHTKPSDQWQIPTAAIAGTNFGKTQAGAVTPIDGSNPNVDNSVNDAEMKKLQRQNNITIPGITPPSAEPVSTAPTSAAVTAKTNENTRLNLQAVTNSTDSTITNNSVVNKTQTQQRKIVMPSVRNMEETFQRTIYNSTRVV